MTVTITTHSPAQTQALAERLAKLLRPGDVLAYTGPMGAGKTTFIKALCRALGIDGVTSSPTFSLVNEYVSGSGDTVYHFDVYRIGDISEMDEVGYEDCFYGEGVTLIEWSNMIEEILPEHVKTVTIEKNLEKGFDYRKITVEDK